MKVPRFANQLEQRHAGAGVVSIDETSRAVQGMPRAQLAVLAGTPHPFELRLPLVASMVRDFMTTADSRRI